jgi:hypothetical protein
MEPGAREEMRQLEDKERSVDVNELAKRNGPGEEQAKEENRGIKRRAGGGSRTPE